MFREHVNIQSKINERGTLMPKVCILPTLSEYGNRTWGGPLRRVEAINKYAEIYGWQVVKNPDEADVIHTLATRSHPDASVYTICGFWENPEERHKPTQDKIDKMVAETSVVTMPSQWVYDFFFAKYQREFIIVNNGIDLSKIRLTKHGEGLKFLGLDKPYFLWGKGGNYFPNCNYGSKPFIELAKQMPNYTFVVVPEPLVEYPSNVIVTGRLPYKRMLEVIADCSVYVSTVKETFGAQTTEAMAFGKPVLGYDFGGTGELVTHELNGYLVEPGNNLLEGVEYILGHYNKMSKWAKIVTPRYSWRAIMPKYVKCWRTALKRK